MSIADSQYGSELITDKGRVLKFDAAECMVNQLTKESTAYQKLYAVPYDAPKTLKSVDSLTFIIDPQFRSPMGANLAAFAVAENAPQGVKKLSWEETIIKLSHK
jgi:copper chaperone NosL